MGETQGDQLYIYPFKDTHSAFKYDSSWSSNVTDTGRFSGGTGQYVPSVRVRPARVLDMI